MKARFEGHDGKRLLVEVLKQQEAVQNDAALAESLASVGVLQELAPGEVLISANSADNSIFFILSGRAAIYVNKRHVATRNPRECIGEMALLEPSAPRSATVTAAETLTVLRVLEPQFRQVAHKHPDVWMALARILTARLRERSKFHRAPNLRPIVFVGSSVEGLAVARNLQLLLKHSSIEFRLWTSGVFGPSGVTIDALIEQAGACDFAAFVFGPDDKVSSRGEDQNAPRDNVVFELGLFMGSLGRERTVLIREHKMDLKIPTDLLGVTPLTYLSSAGSDLNAALGPVCTEFESLVNSLGPR